MTILRIELKLVIDEQELSLDYEATSDNVKAELMMAMSEWIDEIDDWAHQYTFYNNNGDEIE